MARARAEPSQGGEGFFTRASLRGILGVVGAVPETTHAVRKVAICS
jgi:hypothetical protein